MYRYDTVGIENFYVFDADDNFYSNTTVTSVQLHSTSALYRYCTVRYQYTDNTIRLKLCSAVDK